MMHDTELLQLHESLLAAETHLKRIQNDSMMDNNSHLVAARLIANKRLSPYDVDKSPSSRLSIVSDGQDPSLHQHAFQQQIQEIDEQGNNFKSVVDANGFLKRAEHEIVHWSDRATRAEKSIAELEKVVSRLQREVADAHRDMAIERERRVRAEEKLNEADRERRDLLETNKILQERSEVAELKLAHSREAEGLSHRLAMQRAKDTEVRVREMEEMILELRSRAFDIAVKCPVESQYQRELDKMRKDALVLRELLLPCEMIFSATSGPLIGANNATAHPLLKDAEVAIASVREALLQWGTNGTSASTSATTITAAAANNKNKSMSKEGVVGNSSKSSSPNASRLEVEGNGISKVQQQHRQSSQTLAEVEEYFALLNRRK